MENKRPLTSSEEEDDFDDPDEAKTITYNSAPSEESRKVTNRLSWDEIGSIIKQSAVDTIFAC